MDTTDNMWDYPTDEKTGDYEDDIKPWETTEQKIEAVMKFQEIIEKFTDTKIYYATPEQFDKIDSGFKHIVGGIELAIIHKGEKYIDRYEEHKKDLEPLKKFLETTEAKLSNENFIKKAPKDIIDKEWKKWEDCMDRIFFTMNLCLDDLQKRIDELKQIKDGSK